MKKSQLKNIIKESIKEVIKEQLTNPGYVCDDSNCLDRSNPQNNQSFIQGASGQIPTFPGLNACLNSGCAGSDLCKQCQRSIWPGFQSWANSFMSQPPFSSTNPNQPCNFICDRIQTFQNNCSNTTGPQHKNKLGCKIQLAQMLTHPSHYGCSC